VPRVERALDEAKPVRAHWNLKRKCYSLLQDGLVVGYATSLFLRDVTFVVHRSGWARAYNTGERNVHAFLDGHVQWWTYSTKGLDRSVPNKAARTQIHYSLPLGEFHADSLAALKSAVYVQCFSWDRASWVFAGGIQYAQT
jgi:hypothetical protein